MSGCRIPQKFARSGPNIENVVEGYTVSIVLDRVSTALYIPSVLSMLSIG